MSEKLAHAGKPKGPPIREILRDRVKQWKGVDVQEGIAKRGGISQKTVSNAENAKNIRLDMLEGIATAWRVPSYIMLIPGELTLDQAKEINQIVSDYLASLDDGKKNISRVAATEARYASMEDR